MFKCGLLHFEMLYDYNVCKQSFIRHLAAISNLDPHPTFAYWTSSTIIIYQLHISDILSSFYIYILNYADSFGSQFVFAPRVPCKFCILEIARNTIILTRFTFLISLDTNMSVFMTKY